MGALVSPRRSVMRHLRAARRLDSWETPLTRALAHVVRYRLARTWGVYVHPTATVGDVWFAHPVAVVIGAGAVVEDGVTIYQNVTLGARDNSEGRYPTVERDCVLYSGVTILGGVTIGAGATIGANSLVMSDVPAGCTAVGSPARILCPRPSSGPPEV